MSRYVIMSVFRVEVDCSQTHLVDKTVTAFKIIAKMGFKNLKRRPFKLHFYFSMVVLVIVSCVQV